MGAVLLLGGSACVSPVPAPAAVAPGLVCVLASTQVQVSGDHLAPVAVDTLGEAPSLASATLTWIPSGGLTAGSEPRTDASVRQAPSWAPGGQLEATLGPGTALEPGTWDLAVSGPSGDTGSLASALTVLGRPTLGAVSPAGICLGETLDAVRLSGSDLVVTAEGPPVVQVDGATVAGVTVDDCEPLAGPVSGQVCETLVVPLDGSVLPLGQVTLDVHQPGLGACATSSGVTLEVLEAPETRDVAPAAVCSAGAVLTLEGAGYRDGLTVSLGGVPLEEVQVLDTATVLATLASGSVPNGVQDLTVTLAEGCTHTLPEAVLVQPPPLVYAIEPPVLPAGAAVTLVARMADSSGEPIDAWLVDPDGTRVDAPWTWDVQAPDQVLVTLDGSEAEGSWTVGVALANGCEGDPGGSLEIVAQEALTLSAPDPGHAWAWDRTAISLLAPEPPPEGEPGFVDLPRAWIVGPDGAQGTTALQGLTWRSIGEVTAVVPSGMATGRYDLVVVNPTGEVGWRDRALTITPDAPPQVDSVQPASLASTGTNDLVLRGRDFRDPTVALLCRDGDARSTETVQVVDSEYGRIDAQLSSPSVSSAVCVVEVTNSDGTRARFAGVSIRNPAQNLFPWEAGSSLQEARRAPAGVAGRTTSVTRFVYALGGDDGSASSAMDSLELADIDAYGNLGAWVLVDGAMPGPLTLASAGRVGDFVYLVGGDDGGGPLDTVWRARILDPLDAPEPGSVKVSTTAGGVLSAGTWLYRVAALFDASDAVNPDGESLASDPVAVSLPWGDAAVTLAWTAVEGASGYRVYRSDVADGGSGSEAWLADVTDPEIEDLGQASDPTLVPLAQGSLGAWAPQASLGTARSGACLGVARDPRPDPELVYLYVAGGSDGSQLLDGIEVLDIQVVDDDEQRVGSWRTLDVVLSPPRQHCGVAVVDSSLHSVVDAETSWVYVLAGDDGTKAVGDSQAGLVLEGGDLGDWQDVKALSPARAGFAVASASDFLYAAGGQQGGPSETGVSAELEPDALPDVRNWNSLSTAFTVPRVLPGVAQESAIWLVLGGDTDAGPTVSTDLTHY